MIRKRVPLLFLLLSIAGTISLMPGFAQSQCLPFLRPKDTTICPGTTITLNTVPKDTLLPGVWKLLISGAAIDPNNFNLRQFGYDKARQYLYSVNHQQIVRYDLKNNLISNIPAINWPGDFFEFTYDFTGDRLFAWLNGRDKVYVIPASGGSWALYGTGATDNEANGASDYWNPVKGQPGLYGGLGSSQVKGWIYENDGTGWQVRRANPFVAVPPDPPKGGNILAGNSDGTKLYLFSGMGNYSGNEETSCSLGSPWANSASGYFCWLRDLWELDLMTYTFTNILPVNNTSILYEGAFGYDYDKARFYIFGGYKPPANYLDFVSNTNRTFSMRTGKDAGFVEFTGEGGAPPSQAVSSLKNYAYYDAVGKRMIWARYDGIWAYYPDSTTAPRPDTAYLWSTGATTRSITVQPSQTTKYIVTRTINGVNACKDSVTVSLNGIKGPLQDTVKVCGTAAVLDAGTGFVSYAWSTGETTQTIQAKSDGRYIVTVSNGTCTIKDTSEVRLAAPILNFSVGILKDSVCAGEKDSLYVVSPQPGITYTWYLSGNATPVATGNYLLANNPVKDTTYVISATGVPPVCTPKSVTARIIVRLKLAAPVVRDSASLNNIVFRWNAIPGATGYQVSLDSGFSYTNPSSGLQGLTHIVSGLQPNQTVKIWVKALGLYSCQNSDSTRAVAATKNPFGDGIYIPNAFTPNGDGVNDEFRVYSNEIGSMKLSIYSQWGEQLFMSTDMTRGWDGMYKGGKAPGGRYTYALEAVMQSGKKVTRAGSFSLIR